MQLSSIFAVCGTVVSCFMFLSGVTVFYAITKQKSIGNYSSLPYYSMFGNCFLWLNYGVCLRNPDIGIVNGIGSCISLTYIVIYAWFGGKQKRYSIMEVGIIVLCALALVPQVFLRGWEHHCTSIGFAAFLLNMVMYGSPLEALLKALRSKDISSLPLLTIFASLICSAVWCAYGLLIKDWFIYVPNIAGVLLAFLQFAILGYLYMHQDKKNLSDPLLADVKPADGHYTLLEAETTLQGPANV